MSETFPSIYTKKMAFFSLLAIFFIFLDRSLKVVASLLWSTQPIKVLTWFNLSCLPNDSLAFSVPANKYFILILVILLLVILTVVYLKKLQARNWQAIWWWLIILGASSNLLDRLLYGAVIDYLQISWFTAFNLADVLITLGVGALLFQEFTAPTNTNK